ncbi:MAG: hypothetical protein ACJA2S_002861 [Cyclobacteriaceae bacterium]|jgi:hypothetical protein
MVNSKPKVSTLFSVGIFLAIAYGVFIYSLINYLNSEIPSTITLVLIVATGPIAMVITLKTLLGVKFIEINKEKFSVNYPFRFKKIKFSGKEIASWKIDQIKTLGGLYEELIWKLKSGKQYSMSKQEHTEFDKARSYMIKKFKKLQES